MSKQIDLTVIDQMYAAQMSMNESEETINALRPQAEEAVKELLRQEDHEELLVELGIGCV